MKKIIDTTDKKHIGDVIDDTQDVIQFSDGGLMQVVMRLHNNTVLANSNYIVVVEDADG